MPSLASVGRLLVVLGLLLAAFVAYQLWGTGIVQSREQHSLREQFDRILAPRHGPMARPPGTPDHRTVTPAQPADPAPATGVPTAAPATGQPVATIDIPAIGIDQVVVEGVGAAQLAEGPGHYPGTALPGQPGNAAVAGHRTTHGRPFYDLDALVVGDPVVVTTVQGTFRYLVSRSEVVAPTDTTVLDPSTVPELTLTTCTPRYSAARRLVVVARLVSPAATARPAITPAAGHGPVASVSADSDPIHQAGDWARLGVWGLACIALVVTALALQRRGRPTRRWLAPLVAAPLALVVLFFFFGAVNTMLPPSF